MMNYSSFCGIRLQVEFGDQGFAHITNPGSAKN